MEQELYEGLRKSRRWALEAVCRENLKRSWYLCCQLAGEPAGGAPLLLSAWKEALAAVKGMETLPSQDFAAILSEKIAALYQRGVAPKLQYEALAGSLLSGSGNRGGKAAVQAAALLLAFRVRRRHPPAAGVRRRVGA